jgi:hypothetical protein
MQIMYLAGGQFVQDFGGEGSSDVTKPRKSGMLVSLIILVLPAWLQKLIYIAWVM